MATPVQLDPATPPGASAPGGVVPLLRVVGLRKRYGRSEQVLNGVSLDVHAGEMVVVLGANGSGKSTLLRCVTRLINPDAGQVLVGGRDMAAVRGRALRRARRETAMVFQQIHLVRRRTALQNVANGALGRLGSVRSMLFRLVPADVREHARWSLERVGLADKANARADTLSGGQAQRVAIARALCQRASVILADEPVASLDPRAADEILALLADVAHREHVGVLCVLHQPDLARRYADRLVGIAHGSVSFDDAPDRISDAAIADLYDGLGEAAATVSTTSPRWRRIALWSVVAVALAALYRHGWVDTEVSLGSLVDGFHNLVDITKGAWPPARGVLRDSIDASIVTFDTALLGTTIALLFAVIVAPLAASNTSPSRAVYELTRTLIAILRTIPDVIFALLFVVAVGLGPFAGVLAIGLHSIGTLGKLFAEAIEEIEMGPVNALRVAGARRLQVFVHAVVPSVASTWTSLLLYRFDVNIRSSIILGIVGAGGIGFNISNSMQLFQYREVTTELGVMLVLVLVVERASSLLRRRIG